MRNILLTVFVAALLSACSNSIDKDAKEAAKLSALSIEYSKNNDNASAEKVFLQKQEIFNKYKQSADFEKFEALHNQYLLEIKKDK